MMIKYLLILLLLSSCFSKEKKGHLNFTNLSEERKLEKEKDLEEKRRRKAIQDEIKREIERKKRLKVEKVESWKRIVKEAKYDYGDIKKIIDNKCSACHDRSKKLHWLKSKLPAWLYDFKGKWVISINALDFKEKFPLKDKGNNLQLALLQTLKSTVAITSSSEDKIKIMPPKNYTKIPWNRSKRLNDNDRSLIYGWINPIIEKIKEHDQKFSELDNDGSLDSIITKVFQINCYKCHANGADDGGFGQMQDLKKLVNNNKYINLNNPEESMLYTISASGEMPYRQDALESFELELMLDWIKSKSKTK